MNMHVPALQRSLSDVVAEYDVKRAAIGDAIRTFEKAGTELKMAAIVGGTYGDVVLDVGRGIYESTMEISLLKSAWKHVYDGLNIDRLASPQDKVRWKQALEKPQPFTIDNIRATFGKYILDPRGNILRALAEVFCGLDQAYKSHDKVKIGVAGLPKRIIVGSVGGYGSYGRDKIISVMNAIASYQGAPLIEHNELQSLDDLHKWSGHIAGVVTIRGLTIKKFQNGNAHVMFDKGTLTDINKALAEFYGDVLPDTTEEKPEKKQASTAVSKDLQYYPTPAAVVKDVLDHMGNLNGAHVLEPSCGCGRFMDALRKAGADVYGIEVDFGRAATSRAKGHAVLRANFLEVTPPNDLTAHGFDRVVMNPPFYGKHYAKHVRHAFDFLKPGGTLTAILPVTAQEHGLLDDLSPSSRWSYDSRWRDLPVGSFAESGTNINTVVLTISKPQT
jgi:SAM-dependent methyltransferase